MRKHTKLISVLISVLILATFILMFAVSPVLASTPRDLIGTDPGSKGEMFKIGNQIIGFVKIAGMILAVVILIVIGIKYMIGSAEEKAEYKKTMIPYLIGAVLIFAASALAQIIYDWAIKIGEV